jgi:hypothetical protein
LTDVTVVGKTPGMLADVAATLAHPLLLLAVGAAVSSFLVPAVTRRWQDHQKELEVKVGLVDQISKAVAEFLIAIQFAELQAQSQSQEEFDDAYRAWEVAQPTIGGRLQAYFPESSLPSEWAELTRRVTAFYGATGVSDGTERVRRLREIAAVSDADDRSATELWREAKVSLLRANDRLSSRVLTERIPDFNRPLFRLQGLR